MKRNLQKLSFRFYSKMKPAASFSPVQNELLNSDIRITDPQLHNLISKERERQRKGLELIPSENYASLSVLQCLGSCLTNKYSEGMPGVRYYGGNEFIDEIEILCQKRALKAFRLNPEEWGVNVQPYSGSPANFAVYTALVGPQGRIMGLDLPDGGHLTHGFRAGEKKVSATSLYFDSLAYKVNPETGLIDYDKLEESARSFKPKLIIAGISCYSRCLDYERFRKICDENGCYLFADMSHVSGLIAAGVIPSPFEYADVVASTTHKTLRGPRAGVIFFRKGVKAETDTGEKILYDLESKINNAVFPGLQGGPHNNAIAAIATAMLQATTPEFKSYQKQVVANAKRLSEKLIELGFKIVTGGTDVHLLLVDLKPFKISGAKAEYILELVGIACNKNTVPGDKSPLNPSGIRIGTPALTTRGMKEEHMDVVSELLLKCVNLAKEVQVTSGPKLVDFKKCLKEDEKYTEKIAALKSAVEEFAENFFMPQETFEN